jgi:sugar phosphate isomerase/epimerase
VNDTLTRRQWLAGTTAVVGASLASVPAIARAEVRAERKDLEPFRYCLNTSTISGQKLDLVQVVEIAAKAGYQAIEPWIREVDQYVKSGANLKDLGQRIRDRGLSIESAIGFFEWIVDDDARRKKALEEARRNFDLVQQLGGKRLAAPPLGATNQPIVSLAQAAVRYRELLELGDKFGVVAEAEIWGHSQTLGRLSEAAFVALECGHPRACILADVYHLYKGGSSLSSLRLLSGAAIHVLHFNDYPADPPRSSITDAQRVYPGDGVAPLKEILQARRATGSPCVLSLELFNRDYWKQDALTVAKTGLEKMRAVVQRSLS